MVCATSTFTLSLNTMNVQKNIKLEKIYAAYEISSLLIIKFQFKVIAIKFTTLIGKSHMMHKSFINLF